MLGYAATTDVRDVPVVVADGDRTPASRELIARFEASPNFALIATVTTVSEIEPYLERGSAWLALSIPNGYATEIESRRLRCRAGRRRRHGLEFDDRRARLRDQPGRRLRAGARVGRDDGTRSRSGAATGLTAAGSLDGRIRVWFNPQLESRFFMIPGVLALILLVVTANLASMAIVREKELGTLEQLNVTPLRRWELIVGKLLPYGVIALVDVLLVVAVAVFWFEVPLRGSFVLLFAMSLVYVLCTLALGLFISTVSNTQQQAMMTATFFFLTPMIYLSGFIFPIENMPAVIQPFTYLIPLRYYLVIVRGIFLKGVGLEVLWPQAAAMAAWGAGMIALAVLRSQKRAA